MLWDEPKHTWPQNIIQNYNYKLQMQLQKQDGRSKKLRINNIYLYI